MLSAFENLKAQVVDRKFCVIFEESQIQIYSERSGVRDLAQLQAAIAEVPNNQTLIIVAPYTEALRQIFDGDHKLFFISPVTFTTHVPMDARWIADDAALEAFILAIDKNDTFSIFAIPQWQAAHDYVMAVMKQLLERAAVRLKTIGYFDRLWQINFRLNLPAAESYSDITALKAYQPDTLVMAGPSLDSALVGLKQAKMIWCADTALPVLLQKKIYPQVIFSTDAGFASQEHFVGAAQYLRHSQTLLVCDMLGRPAVQRLAFSRRITYASSHPLVQQFCASHRPNLTRVENPQGDVGSLMRAIFTKLFGAASVQIYGHDGRQRRFVTHARGTAYFNRSYAAMTRLYNAETYMLKLSRRYS